MREMQLHSSQTFPEKGKERLSSRKERLSSTLNRNFTFVWGIGGRWAGEFAPPTGSVADSETQAAVSKKSYSSPAKCLQVTYTTTL